MRSKVAQRIQAETPGHVLVFVRWYTCIVVGLYKVARLKNRF